ncbi:MAG: DUF4056 domain-containing protein [bacterium]
MPISRFERLRERSAWRGAAGLVAGSLLALRGAAAAPLSEDQLSRTPRERLCCAFGHDLDAGLAAVPITVHLDNVKSIEGITAHSYVSRSNVEEVAELFGEKYGLVYTCRGGFIDIAHASDFADWTAYLSAQIARTTTVEQQLVLPCAAGTARLVIHPVAADDPRAGLESALTLAQRIAYELSVLHEITSWFDVSTFSMVSEKVSAFSPEDSYSNLLGTYVGRRAVLSPQPYDQAAHAELRAALRELGAVDVADTRAAFDQIAGRWWDGTKRLPEPTVTKRRNLEWGPTALAPWRAPSPLDACATPAGAPAEVLAIPTLDPVTRTPLSSRYQLEFRLDRERLPKTFPYPHESNVVTPADFPALVEAIRADIKREIGPDADTP